MRYVPCVCPSSPRGYRSLRLRVGTSFPALALSELLHPEAFPAVELTHPEAIRYLAREAITLPEGTPRGFVLVRYRGLALGFVKHLGNRSNNLYPQPWRIRHPEQILAPNGQ